MPDLSTEIGIGASNHVSPFCHSVLRVEPYTTCYFGCSYCYARWYRPDGAPRPKAWLLRALRKLWSKLGKMEVRLIPFRFSTLVDPLQPLEAEAKLTLALLGLADKNDIPIVLNTKSVLFSSGAWRNRVEGLASKGLLVLQVSLPTSSEEASALLEPKVPGPGERLKAISVLADEVPVVVRLQPLIPGLFEGEQDRLIEALVSSGVKHVIVEFLRETPQGLKAVYAKLRDLGVVLRPNIWVPYGKSGGLLRPSLAYRRGVLTGLRDNLRKHGISLAPCKEGLFELRDGRDCCGFRFLRADRVAYRLTLYDLWANGWDLDRALRALSNEPSVLYGPRLAPYPRPIRKVLKAHENKLMKILGDPSLLEHVL